MVRKTSRFMSSRIFPSMKNEVRQKKKTNLEQEVVRLPDLLHDVVVDEADAVLVVARHVPEGAARRRGLGRAESDEDGDGADEEGEQEEALEEGGRPRRGEGHL